MGKLMRLGNFQDNDIELCRTTNQRVGNQAVKVLMDARIPFTKNCKAIPFFKRNQYAGAQNLYVITINPNRYSQARRTIDCLDRVYKERLVIQSH